MVRTAIESYLKGLRHYATSEGRASRSEFWCFHLVAFAIDLVAAVADLTLKLAPLAGDRRPLLTIAWALQALPMIGVTTRRLHDVNWSAAWWLVPGCTFVVGFPRGNHGPNRFGPEPSTLQGSPMDIPKRVDPVISAATIELSASNARQVAVGPEHLLREIERLNRLRGQGHVSESEYLALKARTLSHYDSGSLRDG